MKVLTHKICKTGGRDYNQDYADSYFEDNGGCFLACDGLGSYFGSEIVSKMAAVILKASVKSGLSDGGVDEKTLKNYFQNANSMIDEEKEKDYRLHSSCTTVACLIVTEKNTMLAHIGDTRIYIFRQNKLAFQTTDHSLAQLAVERGEIKLRNIRTHKDQNKLTRVLGNSYFSPPDIITMDALRPGDKFLLCTDGFWEYVYEEEMEKIFEAYSTPESAMGAMEKLLLARVDGTNDNYTAIIGYVNG